MPKRGSGVNVAAHVAAGPRFGFRVLGSFEVVVDGQQLDLGGRKPAGLLALLVLRANEVVPTDSLVDELWDGDPPRTARKSLQVHVSRLRRTLGEGVLETKARGYVLNAEPSQVDANVFEQLVEEGRAALRSDDPGTAARLLREALSLWRGPALADLDEPFARTYGARLDEARLAAVELRIDADLAVGRHVELIGELETLVAEHPYHEGLRRRLMLALYRAGRQADALAVYRATRATMAEDLGIEPGPELRELEAAVLRHDPSLGAPRSAQPRAKASRARFAVAGALGLAALVLIAVAVGTRLRSSGEPPPVVVPDSLLELDPRTNEVVKVTRVGRGPDRLAVGGDAVWVVNRRDRTLSRVQASGEVDTIGGVVNVDHVVVDGDDVWLSSFDKSSVARIDARSAELVETIGIPSRHAEGMTVGGGYLWITNPATVRAKGTETVSRFDLRSREVVSTHAVGKTPIFTTFGFGSVWVSNYDDDTVSVISPGSTSAETIRVEDGPLGIATGFGSVWVVCYWRQQLLRIDPSSRRVVARIEIGRGPLSVAAGSGGVWVTNRDSRTVSRIDPLSNRVVAEIAIPSPASPQGVVTGGDTVWVSVNRCPQAPCF